MRTLKVSKNGVNRYTLHFGTHTVDGDWELVGPLIQGILEEALIEANGDLVNFEFVGNLPDRELTNVFHELKAMREARQICWQAKQDNVSRVELCRVYDNFVTLAWTVNFVKLFKVLGFERPEEQNDEQVAS